MLPRAKLHKMFVDYLEILENLRYKNTGPAIITGISPFFHEYSKPKAITQFYLISSSHCSLKVALLSTADHYKGERKCSKLNSPCNLKEEM